MAKRRYKRSKKHTWSYLIPCLLLVLIGYFTFYLLTERGKTVPRKEVEETREPTIITALERKHKPRIAFIIDDLGYDRKIAQDFLTLDIPLTYSILPFSDHGKTIAKRACSKGCEVMLHIPMEADNFPKMNPEDGFLFVNMDRETLLAQLRKDLDNIPYIKGVNNHMGSKFTQSTPHMRWVLEEIKSRNLFFVDSLTTNISKGFPIAREIGVKTVRRDVFLDNIKEPTAIMAQIDQLIDIAQKRGFAIAIAHPHPLTYKTLRETIPELKKKAEIVYVSQLLH